MQPHHAQTLLILAVNHDPPRCPQKSRHNDKDENTQVHAIMLRSHADDFNCRSTGRTQLPEVVLRRLSG